MKIWVDADACPGVIKEILFRVAERTQTPVTLVANQALRTPPSRLITAIQVPGGFDVADDEIVRRTDPGDPARCPVYDLHKVYSDPDVLTWAAEGCRSAGIGCIDCKQPLADRVKAECETMRQRAKQFEEDPDLVLTIIQEGSEKARNVARETLEDVKDAIVRSLSANQNKKF